MATHVVCPLCGKSSSLSSFPSGPGNDVFLQTFRGLGRKRGFKVVGRSSGLGDEGLCRKLVPKVVALVTVLARRGYLTPDAIEKAVGKTVASKDLEKARDVAWGWKNRAETFEKTLEKERAHAEWEVDRLEKDLEESKEKLSELEGERERLAASAKDHIASMRNLLGELEEALLADETLSDVYSSLKEKTDAFEESVTGSVSSSFLDFDFANV